MSLYPIFNSPKMATLSPGIYYDNRRFSAPRRFPGLLIPPIPGIYAILIPDAQMKPRQFRLLYIGETEDLNKRVCELHEKHESWKREAAGRPLYFAYHETIGMTTQQRKDAECAIIAKYDPPCNIQLRPLGGLHS